MNKTAIVFSALLCACANLGIGASPARLGVGPGGVDVTRPQLHVTITQTGHADTTLAAWTDIAQNMGGVTYQAGYADVGATIRTAVLATEPNADVVFAIDTTGSMILALPDVKSEVEAALRSLAASQPDRRFGLVAYRDKVDQSTYVTNVAAPLGTPVDATIAALRALGGDGGGDFPEHVWAGLDAALRQPWRPGVGRWIILIGDAPPHDDYADDPRNRANELGLAHQQGVRVSTVAITCSLVCKKEIGL